MTSSLLYGHYLYERMDTRANCSDCLTDHANPEVVVIDRKWSVREIRHLAPPPTSPDRRTSGLCYDVINIGKRRSDAQIHKNRGRSFWIVNQKRKKEKKSMQHVFYLANYDVLIKTEQICMHVRVHAYVFVCLHTCSCACVRVHVCRSVTCTSRFLL